MIASELRLDKSFVNYAAQSQLRRLTVAAAHATADERSVEANIFASARNTVRIRRRLQRIGIQSSAAAAVRDITTYKCLQLSLERQVAVET